MACTSASTCSAAAVAVSGGRPAVALGKVAIVGAGMVGKSWAVIFSRGGFPVTMFDSDAKAVSAAVADIKSSLQNLKDAGLLPHDSVETVAARVRGVSSLEEALKDAIYIQECVPENLDLKRKVSLAIDRALTQLGNGGTVVGSSTSGITASQFTDTLTHRARFLVAHPVNPPFAIPLVELVPAPWTDPAAVAFTRALMTQVGQKPVTLNKEVDGFALNRLQFALLAEAYRLVEDGVCSPEDVDTVVHSGLALRWSFMGPFQTIDLNAPKGVKDYCERYAPGILRVVKAQDNQRDWKPETIQRIEDALRLEVPASGLQQRAEWRNRRLVALAVHKRQQEELEARRAAAAAAIVSSGSSSSDASSSRRSRL